MNKQDAIKCLKSIQQWVLDCDDREDGLSYWDAIDMAIDAIDPPNEPLTWDELGTMIEKPVYIVEMENGKSYWALVYTVGDTGTLFASAIDLNDYGFRELYGKSWLAYRRPPEGR